MKMRTTKTYSDALKNEIVKKLVNGKASTDELAQKHNIPKSTIFSWLVKHREECNEVNATKNKNKPKTATTASAKVAKVDTIVVRNVPTTEPTPRPYYFYAPEFKQKVVNEVNKGRRCVEVAGEMKVSTSSVYQWVTEAKKAKAKKEKDASSPKMRMVASFEQVDTGKLKTIAASDNDIGTVKRYFTEVNTDLRNERDFYKKQMEHFMALSLELVKKMR